jgi:hypothetical protein
MTDTEQLRDAALALRKASSPLSVWWTMVEAQQELAEKPIEDKTVILHFMGSGASTMVTAGEFRSWMDALGTLATLLMTPEEKAAAAALKNALHEHFNQQSTKP